MFTTFITTAYWSPWRDSNSRLLRSKRSTLVHWVTEAICWCAVRDLNSHLRFRRPVFYPVEITAQILVEEVRFELTNDGIKTHCPRPLGDSPLILSSIYCYIAWFICQHIFANVYDKMHRFLYTLSSWFLPLAFSPLASHPQGRPLSLHVLSAEPGLRSQRRIIHTCQINEHMKVLYWTSFLLVSSGTCKLLTSSQPFFLLARALVLLLLTTHCFFFLCLSSKIVP